MGALPNRCGREASSWVATTKVESCQEGEIQMKPNMWHRVVAFSVLIVIAALVSGVPESVVANYHWTHRQQVSDSNCRALGGRPFFARSGPDSVFFHAGGMTMAFSCASGPRRGMES
jgi:hypothetical protein